MVRRVRPITTWEPHWRRSGQEPDYRFSLANERTFLAWIRSALGLLAGGVLLVQFATRLQPPWLPAAIGVALAGFAGVLSAVAYRQWRDNEIAMRHARPLPSSAAIPLLAALVVLVAAVIVVAVWRT
jgi:putative membrane protein